MKTKDFKPVYRYSLNSVGEYNVYIKRTKQYNNRQARMAGYKS